MNGDETKGKDAWEQFDESCQEKPNEEVKQENPDDFSKLMPILDFPKSGPLIPPTILAKSSQPSIEFPKSGPLKPPDNILDFPKSGPLKPPVQILEFPKSGPLRPPDRNLEFPKSGPLKPPTNRLNTEATPDKNGKVNYWYHMQFEFTNLH